MNFIKLTLIFTFLASGVFAQDANRRLIHDSAVYGCIAGVTEFLKEKRLKDTLDDRKHYIKLCFEVANTLIKKLEGEEI